MPSSPYLPALVSALIVGDAVMFSYLRNRIPFLNLPLRALGTETGKISAQNLVVLPSHLLVVLPVYKKCKLIASHYYSEISVD